MINYMLPTENEQRKKLKVTKSNEKQRPTRLI